MSIFEKIRDQRGSFIAHSKAWWRCPVNPAQEVCPFCAGRQASKEYSLETEFPKIAKEWNVAKNGKLRPCDVTPHSGKRDNLTLSPLLNQEFDRMKNNVPAMEITLVSKKKIWWKCSKC